MKNMTPDEKKKKTIEMEQKWKGAKADAIKTMETIMKPVKVTPPPKGKGNDCMSWDSSQEKPSFSLSSKQIENMPESKPGDTVKLVMECTVKRCELNEDKSSEYRLEIDKLGIV